MASHSSPARKLSNASKTGPLPRVLLSLLSLVGKTALDSSVSTTKRKHGTLARQISKVVRDLAHKLGRKGVLGKSILAKGRRQALCGYLGGLTMSTTILPTLIPSHMTNTKPTNPALPHPSNVLLSLES